MENPDGLAQLERKLSRIDNSLDETNELLKKIGGDIKYGTNDTAIQLFIGLAQAALLALILWRVW